MGNVTSRTNCQTINCLNFKLSITYCILAIVFFSLIKKEEEDIFSKDSKMSEINIDFYRYKLVEEDIFAKLLSKGNLTILKFLVGGYFAIASVAHMIYALDPYGWYEECLEHKNSCFKLLEQGITMSIMVSIIMWLLGVKEYIMYWMMCFSVSILTISAILSEASICRLKFLQDFRDCRLWLINGISLLAFAAIFTPIIYYFFKVKEDLK